MWRFVVVFRWRGPMRLILVTICSLVFSLIIFWTIKFWGRSQTFVIYPHPLFSYAEQNKKPLFFIKPSAVVVDRALDGPENLYLDVATTGDQKVVVAKRIWDKKEKPIRYLNYADIKADVILLSDAKDKLSTRKLILNLSENAQAGHMIFFDELKKMGMEKGENIIVTSPYEAMIKALKEVAPTFLYGSTQPEILKIVAMKAMWLVEAVNLRADIVIHPLMIKNEKFYDDTLLTELQRRHKNFIVGPIDDVQIAEAVALKPWGIVVDK